MKVVGYYVRDGKTKHAGEYLHMWNSRGDADFQAEQEKAERFDLNEYGLAEELAGYSGGRVVRIVKKDRTAEHAELVALRAEVKRLRQPLPGLTQWQNATGDDRAAVLHMLREYLYFRQIASAAAIQLLTSLAKEPK